MNKMTKVVSLAALVACVLGAGAAAKAETITLKLVYLGSTTATNSSNAGNLAANGKTNGSSISSFVSSTGATSSTADGVFNAGSLLTNYDLNSSVTQATAGLKNYYGVYVSFSGVANGTAGDALDSVGFNIVTTGAIAPVSSTNKVDTTTQKWIPFNPSVADPINSNFSSFQTWTTNGSLDQASNGTGHGPGTLNLIDVVQASTPSAVANSSAYTTLAGTTMTAGTVASGLDGPGYDSSRGGTLLGVFAIQFTNGALASNATVQLQVTQNSYAYYNPGNQSSPLSDNSPANVIAPTVTILGTAVPEPASLGVLALGGLALIARRRKTA